MTSPRSPGWLFHLGLGVVVALRLWAASTPAGPQALLWLGSAVVFSVAALVWVVWLLAWMRRRRDGASGAAWRFLVAPMCATLSVAVLVLDLPLQVRWSLAQESFDRAVESAPASAPDQPVAFDVPAVLGSYRVDRAVAIGDDVFLSVASDPLESRSGGFLLSSGFAHLPTGRAPSPDPVGRGHGKVHYRHVDGDWYAWAASW
jgi:hypothetical protein